MIKLQLKQQPLMLQLLLLMIIGSSVQISEGLQVGVGVADITGPAGEVPMMGYAEPSQKTAGIHTRLYARAFVFRDASGSTIAFVNVDAGMISQMLRIRVNEILREKLGRSVFTNKNVLLTATHTHSGPGGFHGYTLYAVAALGYMKDTFDAFSHGIAQSILIAYSKLREAKLFYNEGTVPASSINRSPSSYLLNPVEERKRYTDNVDREMQLLKISDAKSGNPFGMMNWHAVHGTSLNNTNQLISGDNKGWAAQLFERSMDKGKTLPGNHNFVASFANSNEGDVSPNTAGPRCIDTGEPCDILISACGGSAKKCVAAGPGRDMFDSSRLIALKQFTVAKSLFESASEELSESATISYVHQTVDMSNYTLTVNGKQVSTCPPAMGFSFAAGTTDGPGGFDFTQGDTSGNKFWNLVRNVISKPNPQQVKCQHPKPILLNTGYMTFPTEWQPHLVETQLLRIGNLVLVSLPGEFTTMSGRRVKEAVHQTLTNNGLPNAKVILCGLSNLYSSYIATYEEYQAQRYEAASTIFGPHTLSAYVEQFKKLAKALATGTSLQDDGEVPNLYKKIKSYSFVTPVVFDSVGLGHQFGEVVQQPMEAYAAGEIVKASFRTGHPRNNMQLNGSFLLVQRKRSDGSWETVCNDACVETRFSWLRTNSVLGRSEARMEWHIPACVMAGTYRLVHNGHYKPVMMWQSVKAFTGITREFTVRNGRLVQQSEATADVINNQFGCGCV